MKKVFVLLVVFCLFIVLIAPSVSAKQSKGNETSVNYQLSDELIEEVQKGKAISPYVDSSDLFIEFDHKQALKDGLDEILVEQTKEVYDKANDYLLKQQNTQKSQLTVGTSSVEPSCRGSNYEDLEFWGGTVYVDSCKADHMAAIIAIGGGVAAIVGFFPGATPLGVAAAVYTTVTAGAINYANAGSTGVKFNVARNWYWHDSYSIVCVRSQ
ncbi:hypothetical protein [Aquisalibacillus elongatus]|uniref:Uncharacterized protein n=1 Tax=Aquisalibacillus elongatus TaxID=485577 RepID=A0A3N5B3I0_9BACI|nr:hypothetical protein [Aquisalibacillus elongatus]RPF52216.1 hypothetical protein EDC24_2208 [Aquisalibacillus elongatus]